MILLLVLDRDVKLQTRKMRTYEKDNELFDKNIESYAKAIADGIIEEIKDELDGR